MKNKYVIGLDIGTTSVKAVLFDLIGQVISEKEIEYPLHTPREGWAEQDPLEIEKATIQVIYKVIHEKNIDKYQILTVGLSCAMHSLICMDEEGDPLSPSITWADGRSMDQAERLRNERLGIDLYKKTGTPIHPMSPLMKLMWMKENQYTPYQKASKFVSIKEFLLYRWFGQEVVDYSVAAATGLFNFSELTWDQTALKLAGITEEQLFFPKPPSHVLYGMKKSISEKIGFGKDIPFVIGATDGPLANLGIGAIEPGEMAITIGTSGAIRQMTQQPKIDSKQKTFCYAFTDQLSLVGGPVNNGGIVLKWLKDLLGSNTDYDQLTQLCSNVQPGAEGIIFLPYLNGERAPIWNPQAKGNLFGLTIRHGKEHIIRAGLEGVVFSIYHVSEALEKIVGQGTKLYASGGFARSDLWIQILADMFNQEIHVPQSYQSSAWGAAWMGLYSIGEVSSLSEIKPYIPMKSSCLPNQKHHEIYKERFAVYKRLNETLSPLYIM
ncbi:gluconokinase [Chengkuizengella axinellae]|uniref:Gluconokinase n=1 Tax=Chengkuizengella axinellae TaxID=3064388 RepID=A0ABT9J362_9BACL|nr:gluconokinase [Chengkuizengella sp. 2205SS18-9]MDP5276056.1 gluconokinase [Chengkuizengella sp. 2205SS18-9]